VSVRRIDQGMAVAAAEVVPRVVDSELRTRYIQIQVMLHSAGLAATYAFIASKAKDGGKLGEAYGKVDRVLRDRLRALGVLTGDVASMSAADVLAALGGLGAAEYARASADAAAFAGWLSRLANALYLASEERDDA
jgi:CRISPR/Cas system CMR-associated protein Cmr5 small subunit